MSTTLTIPADLVGDVRMGLHSLLGVAADSLSAVVDRPDRERHPEWYSEPMAVWGRASALLDVIGWGEPSQAETIEVDADTHGLALTEALELMCLSLAVDVEEAERIEQERAERGRPSTREATAERLKRLMSLAASLEDGDQ